MGRSIADTGVARISELGAVRIAAAAVIGRIYARGIVTTLVGGVTRLANACPADRAVAASRPI